MKRSLIAAFGLVLAGCMTMPQRQEACTTADNIHEKVNEDNKEDGGWAAPLKQGVATIFNTATGGAVNAFYVARTGGCKPEDLGTARTGTKKNAAPAVAPTR